MTAAPGMLVAGRYELAVCLEGGGAQTGENWTATDTVLARPVMMFAPTGGQVVAEGTAAAAIAAARLGHPCIATVYDTAVDSTGTWVVSELPQGRTLQAELDEGGPMAAERVVMLGSQLASAMATAHAAGVTHGRLGLDAVTITDDDRAKVSGFTGTGTPSDDVRALGTILYALLCGHPPQAAPGAPLPLRDSRPGIPPAVETAVLSALGGDSAAEVAAALAAVDIVDDDVAEVVRERTPVLGVRPVARAHRHRWLGGIGALGLVLVAVAVIAAVLAGGGRRPPRLAPQAGTTVQIVGVSAFSPPPQGSGHENDAALALLHDNNPATVWSTQEYATQNFGNLKPGVGVVLQLDGPHTVRTVTIISPSRRWSGEVYVAAQAGPALADWGAPAAHFTVTGPSTDVSLGQTTGSAVLVWITDLGDPNPKATYYPYRVDIGEITIRG